MKTESVSPSPNCFRIRKDTLWLSCADRRGRLQQTVDRWHTTLTRFSCLSSSVMVLPLDLATSPKPRAVILRGEGEGSACVGRDPSHKTHISMMTMGPMKPTDVK